MKSDLKRVARRCCDNANVFHEDPGVWPDYTSFVGFQIGKAVCDCDLNTREEIDEFIKQVWFHVGEACLQEHPGVSQFELDLSRGRYNPGEGYGGEEKSKLLALFKKNALKYLDMFYHPNGEELWVNAYNWDEDRSPAAVYDRMKKLLPIIKRLP